MRIGIDFRPAMFTRTGFGRYVLELSRALGEPEFAGHEIKLFGDAWRRFEYEQRVREVIEGSRARLFRARFPGRLLELLARFGYSVESRLSGIDVFHYTDFVFPPVKRAAVVTSIHDVSFEVDTSYHGPEFKRHVRPRVERVLARAHAVIVPGEETRQRLAMHYGFDPSRVHVVPYGSEHLLAIPPREQLADARLARLGIAAPFILCVGTIEPRKNHARLLRAFQSLLRAIPHHLVVVGGFGWLCDDVRTELAALSGSKRVHVIEDCEDGELRALYARCEFAVYPSLYEGFGFPAVEALALGVPLVTTRGGSLFEVVGDAAEFCDPLDERSIAEAMLRIASSPERRDTAKRRGLARAAELSWASSARGHLRAYRAAIERCDSGDESR